MHAELALQLGASEPDKVEEMDASAAALHAKRFIKFRRLACGRNLNQTRNRWDKRIYGPLRLKENFMKLQLHTNRRAFRGLPKPI